MVHSAPTNQISAPDNGWWHSPLLWTMGGDTPCRTQQQLMTLCVAPGNGWWSLRVEPDKIGTFYFWAPLVWSLIRKCYPCWPGQGVVNIMRCPRQPAPSLRPAPDNGWGRSALPRTTNTLTPHRPGWRGELKKLITSSLYEEEKIWKCEHNQPLASQTWDYEKKGVKSHACVPLRSDQLALECWRWQWWYCFMSTYQNPDFVNK